jgi:hypothetical protein
VKKIEKPFKRSKHRISSVACTKLLLRAFLFVQQNALNFCDYVKAGLIGVAFLIIVVHPYLLFAFLVSINIIGDLTRNIVCLSVFLVDCALGIIGGAYIDYVRTG